MVKCSGTSSSMWDLRPHGIRIGKQVAEFLERAVIVGRKDSQQLKVQGLKTS